MSIALKYTTLKSKTTSICGCRMNLTDLYLKSPITITTTSVVAHADTPTILCAYINSFI